MDGAVGSARQRDRGAAQTPAVKEWSKPFRNSQKARTAPKKEEDRELVGTGFCKLACALE